MDKRFSYKRPASLVERFGSVHGLVEVWEGGSAIGLLNRTQSGYAVRDLEGKLLDTVHVADRATAAGILSLRIRGQEA